MNISLIACGIYLRFILLALLPVAYYVHFLTFETICSRKQMFHYADTIEFIHTFVSK